jgi:hypothetical protein
LFNCINVGGTFRCALPGANGNNGTGGNGGFGTGGNGGQTPGTTPAYGECMGGGCLEGLTCSARGGGFGGGMTGYCTQQCMTTADCTETPSSGTVTPTCGRGGRCQLNCVVDDEEESCPDDMTCNPIGGGQGFPGGGADEDAGMSMPAMGRCGF